MARVWSEEATISAWLRVEAELARAQARTGLITQSDADAISSACSLENIDTPRLWADAEVVGYPILPLVRQITEHLAEGPNGRVHYGATTQDIMDSGLALQVMASIDRTLELLVALGEALRAAVEEHAATPIAGRTHAQQAVPTTFGAKMAVFLEEIRGRVELVSRLRGEVARVSLFGAGGTSAAMGNRSPEVRELLAEGLGLQLEDVPWHVARERLLDFGHALASISAICIRMAREVIDLSRTEVAEVREEFGHHRGASSTMPQKANPIFCEAVIGLGVCTTALSAALLRAAEAGHERSAGEWQIEWIAIPDMCIYTATSISLMTSVVGSMQVFPEQMLRNLEAENGLILSEAVMMKLAPALGREQAHDVVYAAAAEARERNASLTVTLSERVPKELREVVNEVTPESYLGEAARVASIAVSRWDSTAKTLHREGTLS
ncbi:MAG: adenylosuccinate lyase family protein [Actinomycetes bacterium]